MSFRSMLDRRATVLRMVAIKDDQGIVSANPTGQTVGIYPCSAAVAFSTMTQGTPQAKQSEVYSLCFLPNADIRAGDMATIPGIGKLRLGKPRDVCGHHLEVSGAWEGDV